MDRQWTARWIMDRRFAGLKPIDVFHKEEEKPELTPHAAGLHNRHTLFRKNFRLDRAPEAEAMLSITADDYYKVYINGHFVGQGPAQGNYYHYYYNRLDVASHLRQGDNVIAVHVYYHGLISRSYNSGDHRQGLIAELTSGESILTRTDRTWKFRTAAEYGTGEIIGYNTQFLENIDSRRQERGWRSVGYDDSGWLPAFEHVADDHRLFLQPTPLLSVYVAQPRTVERIEDGYLIDFGSELTGQFTVRAQGAAGETVEIRCGEELLPNGRVRYEMRCNCTYRDTWTLSGEEDTLELYDYKAFRYVEVLAAPEAGLLPDSFAAVVRHYPLDDEACRFESSNERLNAIWAICKNGVRFGAQENYVDCPSREKGQYLGDNTIITHAHAYISGDLRMYRKSLADFALLSARVCPGMMAVAPGHHMQEIADFSLQYPLQLLQYYRLSGDLAFLEEMYPAAAGIMEHFAAYRREDGMLESVLDKWNLVDWPQNLRDDYDFELTRGKAYGCHNVINAFYYGALRAMADIREALGLKQPDPEVEMARFRTSFIRAFYNPEQRLFFDAAGSSHASLHANALALLFGLAPKEAVSPIVSLIREKRLSCGVYMAYFVLKALAEADERELLYELIISDDLHSWSTMVKEGATTCFEAWSKDLKWNTSLCHPWASGPIPILIEEVFGIRPASPGWRTVSFSPRMPPSLAEVNLRFRTPAGEIRFACRNGFAELALPEGVAIAT